MPIKTVLTEGRVPVKIWTDDIDEALSQQLLNISMLPFIHRHVAAMPDVHLGKGATVGSVIPTKGAIVPASVGVDLGCGMSAIRLSLTSHALPESLIRVRSEIERAVPHGGPGAKGSWNEAGRRGVPDPVGNTWRTQFAERYKAIVEKHPPAASKMTAEQLGSLGTGNHFIEICLDEEDRVWVMLHSGSRGLGNRIGAHFIAKAKQEMERYFIHLPDKDLAYLVEGTSLFEDYWSAVQFAQEYALANREIMLRLMLTALRVQLAPFQTDEVAVQCHHNYVALENHYGANVYVTRKGAIRARQRDLGIIPGSMGTKSFIVRGKGNRESFQSCSHGAGRRMSRSEAKRRFMVADLEAQTAGVECRKDASVVDEIPGAYKPIEEVMANQGDLVEVVHTLKQVMCVKG